MFLIMEIIVSPYANEVHEIRVNDGVKKKGNGAFLKCSDQLFSSDGVH